VSRGSTILVIAHRLSTIAKADHIYVLSHGIVIEEGAYTTLSIKEGGVFREMLNVQVPSERTFNSQENIIQG
jgi:ATP-binding cassette subfamily B protein